MNISESLPKCTSNLLRIAKMRISSLTWLHCCIYFFHLELQQGNIGDNSAIIVEGKPPAEKAAKSYKCYYNTTD